MNTIKNIVPIGFIYVQFPNEKSPTEIWPLMTWNDVSSAYAGVFFRVTGGEAATPHLVNFNMSNFNGCPDSNGCDHSIIPFPGSSYWVYTGCNGGGTARYARFQSLGGEVRPRNMAIRVWKRTG